MAMLNNQRVDAPQVCTLNLFGDIVTIWSIILSRRNHPTTRVVYRIENPKILVDRCFAHIRAIETELGVPYNLFVVGPI